MGASVKPPALGAAGHLDGEVIDAPDDLVGQIDHGGLLVGLGLAGRLAIGAEARSELGVVRVDLVALFGLGSLSVGKGAFPGLAPGALGMGLTTFFGERGGWALACAFGLLEFFFEIGDGFFQALVGFVQLGDDLEQALGRGALEFFKINGHDGRKGF